MSISRSIRTLAAIGAVAAAAAGCGDGSGGLPDAEFLLRGARAAGADIDSAHVEMTTSAPIAGLAVRELTADVRARQGAEPGASAGEAVVSGLRMRFVERDGQLLARDASGKYLPASAFSANMGQLPNPSVLLDPDRGLTRMLRNFRDPRTEIRETHEGVQAFRVAGDIPQEDARTWLPELRQDARLVVWFATSGRHLPVAARLSMPDESGRIASIDFALSDLNKKVGIPDVS
ncbi:LppX_LprAFG lipoprotein [Nocardia wallacei]|uniref:LppX_LprAFG lipoprotein n=1 Tax=Nocardia wallacei TaxID=480035 RepID=UPI002457D8FE|nr:LppX_LprAFG lipoprotein [Nocardia wallacei]